VQTTKAFRRTASFWLAASSDARAISRPSAAIALQVRNKKNLSKSWSMVSPRGVYRYNTDTMAQAQ
jgi:hypothetical protein